MDEQEPYGDFEEVDENGQKPPVVPGQEEFVRVRLPRQGQFIGVVVQRYGGNRMEIKCTDGKTRNCRVPGRFKRSMWLRNNDVVMIEPWPDDNEKGDIVFQYRGGQISQLRKKGLLNNLTEGF
jgi:translation initiation factor 1A